MCSQYILRNYQMKKIETLPVTILCNVVLRYCVFIKIKYIIRKVILKMIFLYITLDIVALSTFLFPPVQAMGSRLTKKEVARDVTWLDPPRQRAYGNVSCVFVTSLWTQHTTHEAAERRLAQEKQCVRRVDIAQWHLTLGFAGGYCRVSHTGPTLKAPSIGRACFTSKNKNPYTFAS